MPNVRGYKNQHMAQLSYTHNDPLLNLVYNQAFPPLGTPDKQGYFEELDIRSTHIRGKVTSSESSHAQRIGLSDTERTYRNEPISLGFEMFESHLAQWKARNYPSRQGMLNEHQKQISEILKKEKEAQLYTAVGTNTNFEGATYYANAATAWSTTATADPVADILAGKLITRYLNAIAMSETAWTYFQQCTNVLGATTVMGPRRDRSLAPIPTVEHLLNLTGFQYAFISRGDFITDSSDPTDETTTEIWGDSVLLFWHQPQNGPNTPSWLKHTYWEDDMGSSDEGWIVAHDFDPLAGGKGVHYYDTWDYFGFNLHEKSYAYRIDNVY